MTSREFQARTGREERKRLQAERRAVLMGPDGRVRDEYLVPRACPNCAANDPRPAFVAGGVDYALCASCGLLHVPRYANRRARDLIAPRPGVDDLRAAPIYLSPLQREFDEPKFRRGCEILKRHLLPRGDRPRVLDVGTGAGLFLEVLAGAGLEGTGIDYGGTVYQAVHEERGLRVLYGPFEQAELEPESFAAASLWDCLEHMLDPGPVLERLHGILEPGGLLLILVPNAGSLAARALHGACAMFDGIEHINLFTPETLRDFASRRGFAELHFETIIPEINVLNNHLAYDDPYLGESELVEHVLGLPEIDAQTLLARGLGYKILALFRRSG